MIRRREAILAGLCVLLGALPAHAAEWSLDALMDELSARSAGQARFVEKKHLAVLDRQLEQRGELSFERGRLEKLTLTPKRERVVIDGDVLTIESESRKRPRRLRLQDHPVLWGFVESLRATLTGDLATLQRFYAVELRGPREDWELTLAPRVQAMRAVVEVVRIRGTGRRIERVEVTEALGDRSVMQVFEDGS
jgi:hypothetical protein